jgi:hypothetical protein
MYKILFSLLLLSSQAFANFEEVPIKHLQCFHYLHNDPAGVLNRNNMDAKPFMEIIPGNFDYHGWQSGAQKLLINSLDESGNILATDQAVAWQMRTQIGDGRGSIEFDLYISVIEARSNLNLAQAPLSWQLGYISALNDNWRTFYFWNDYSSQISCIEADIMKE